MEIDIVGYDGMYTITKEGDVYSYKIKSKGKRKLKQQKATQSPKGYYQVRLFAPQGDKRGRLQYVHRLVYQAFIGDIPEGKQIDHIDSDTTNNRIENLQILTPRENMDKFNKKKFGPSIRNRRDEFVKLYEKLGSYYAVADEVGITYQRIYRVIKDIIHYKDFETGKYLTRRFDGSYDDKYTMYDLRKHKDKVI